MSPFQALYGRPPPSVSKYIPGTTNVHAVDTTQIGDWVFLKIHPYRQKSLAKHTVHKLSPRYFGPFEITAKVGAVAYCLNLPPHSKIHPVFHVSLLKKRVGDGVPISSTLPPFNDKGEILWKPSKVLDMGVRTKKGRKITTWLIQWDGMPETDATWEDATTIVARYPEFLRTGTH
ncbi:uncharacterized protein LOC121049558 [Rosa chinensis]|uniref:uncharacterized protein LOC121049558 n=1 Tax=Rosa chinensis TaxID=74649 RepID=UPI001AD8D178|nr:uncharacterized protein LOC121049558 [Rosa chinensis]